MACDKILEGVGMFFKSFIGLILSTLLMIFLLPLILVALVSYIVCHVLIYIKYGDTVDRACGLDVLQGFESPQSRPYCTSYARFKGQIDIQTVRRLFKAKALNAKTPKGDLVAKKLRQNFVKLFGYHMFQDDKNFDLANHVQEIDRGDIFTKEELSNERKMDTNGSVINGHSSNDVTVINQINSLMSKYSNEHFNKSLSDVSLSEDEANQEIFRMFQESMMTSDDSNEESQSGPPFEEVMHRLMGKFGNRPFVEGRPKWEMLLFKESNDTYLLLIRVHHSISDGINFVRYFFSHVVDNPTSSYVYDYRKPHWLKRVMYRFWAFCLLPYGLRLLSFGYEKTPLHGPELSGDKAFFVTKQFPLEDLKEIKRKTKCTINGILFTCLSNTIATHFQHKKSSVENVIVLVPKSMTDMSKAIQLKNAFALTGILLPTFLKEKAGSSLMERVPASPVERLKLVQTNVDLTANNPSFISLHWLVKLLTTLLPSCIVKLLLSSKGLTCTLSNLAGPENPNIMYNNDRMFDCGFFIPDRFPMGMGISVGGYLGQVRVGLMVDRALLQKDNQCKEFLENFMKEITALREDLKNHEGNPELSNLIRKEIA